MKKESLGTRQQLVLLAGLGLVLILAVVRWKGTASNAGPQRAAAGGVEVPGEDQPLSRSRGRQEKGVSPEEVPIVTAQDLDPPHLRHEPSSDRNLFDFRPPTPVPQPTPTPAPRPAPVCGNPDLIGPCPPPPPPPTPAPPEIAFKFIGAFGPKDRPIAVLVLGDQTVNAREGDTVFDRFIVRKVGYESIDVGFLGFAPSEIRRLGMGQ